MDRFSDTEKPFNLIGQCPICETMIYENMITYFCDGEYICDDTSCLLKFCKDRFNIQYGIVNKYGEIM